jgi:hypothetical protein
VPKLVYQLASGSEIDSSFDPPYSLREQLDFEEHFRLSFQAMETAVGEAGRVARGGEPDFSKALRTSWILWVGWHRLRPRVAAKYDTFLTQVVEWRVELTDEERARIADAEARAVEEQLGALADGPEPAGGDEEVAEPPDPTVKGDASAPAR